MFSFNPALMLLFLSLAPIHEQRASSPEIHFHPASLGRLLSALLPFPLAYSEISSCDNKPSHYLTRKIQNRSCTRMDSTSCGLTDEFKLSRPEVSFASF